MLYDDDMNKLIVNIVRESQDNYNGMEFVYKGICMVMYSTIYWIQYYAHLLNLSCYKFEHKLIWDEYNIAGKVTDSLSENEKKERRKQLSDNMGNDKP